MTRETSKKSNTSGMSLTMNTSQPLSGSLGTRSAQIVGALFSGSAESTYSHEGTQKGHADGRTTLELTFSSTDKSNTSNNSASFAGSITTGPNNFYGTLVTVGLSSRTSSHDAEETEGVYNTYDNGTLRSADYESTDKTNNSASSKTLSGEAQASLGATWTTHFAYSTSSDTTAQDSSVKDKGHYTTTNGDRVATGTTTESSNNKTEQSGYGYKSDTSRTGLYSISDLLPGSSDNTTVESKSKSTTTSKQNLYDGTYTDHAGTYTARAGQIKTDNSSKSQPETTTAHTFGSRDSAGETKHDNSKSFAKQTETKSKKEEQNVGLVENTLAKQNILDQVFAETKSEEWGDYKQAPVVPKPTSNVYVGSGKSTYTSTLISNTDDGTKGKQSYITSSLDLGSKTIHAKNVPGPAYNNLPWQRSITFDYHKVTSDYEAKHEFTLDSAGQQSATNGKLESNSNSLVLHDVTARDEDKLVSTGDEIEPETGQHYVVGELDTKWKYKNTVTTKEESHDNGDYSGQLRGDGSYSKASGTVTEKKTITDTTDAVFKQDGWGNDGHRDHRETHGFNPAKGVATDNGATVTTFERTQKYDADQIKTTSEISEQNYTAVFTTEAKSTWIGSQGGTYGLSDSNFTRQTSHIKITTDEFGNQTTDKDSKSEADVSAYQHSPEHPEGVLRDLDPLTYHIDPYGNIQNGVAKRLPAAGSSNSGVVDDRISDWEARWYGFWKGAKAEGYALLDAFTPDWLLDVSADKANAWKDARLNGTTTQMIGEFSAGAAREIAIFYATAGLGNVASASRVAAIAMVPVRTALVGRAAYEGFSHTVSAYQNFRDGNPWTGVFHAGLAVLNVFVARAGVGQLKNDVKFAFPKPQVSNRAFSPEEQRIADYIKQKSGLNATPNPREGVPGAGRQGDAIIAGVKHEFKTLEAGADSSTIRNVVNNSIKDGGQARNIVIDARGSGLTEAEALRGMGRAAGISRGKIDNITVIGDDFFLNRAVNAS